MKTESEYIKTGSTQDKLLSSLLREKCYCTPPLRCKLEFGVQSGLTVLLMAVSRGQSWCACVKTCPLPITVRWDQKHIWDPTAALQGRWWARNPEKITETEHSLLRNSFLGTGDHRQHCSKCSRYCCLWPRWADTPGKGRRSRWRDRHTQSASLWEASRQSWNCKWKRKKVKEKWERLSHWDRENSEGGGGERGKVMNKLGRGE